MLYLIISKNISIIINIIILLKNLMIFLKMVIIKRNSHVILLLLNKAFQSNFSKIDKNYGKSKFHI